MKCVENADFNRNRILFIDHTLNVIQLWGYHILTYILEVHWIPIYTEYEIWPLPDVFKLIRCATM